MRLKMIDRQLLIPKSLSTGATTEKTKSTLRTGNNWEVYKLFKVKAMKNYIDFTDAREASNNKDDRNIWSHF